ncbi:MAG: AbiV family abortive infection protein [Nitrospirota bacterium]
MAKRKLDQYKAKLSPAEIAAGMNAAIANARRLCEDAKLLLAQSKYPSASSLAILSIEESGKLSILRALALARDEKELSETWREYRSHTQKNRMWPFLQMVLQGARGLNDFRPLVEDSAEHPYLLDNLKQLGFYTDCLGERHWSVPNDVIDKDLATQMIRIAELHVPKRNVNEREIELWILHVKPVWKGPMEHMEAAVAAWHRQMCEEGLIQDDPEGMERFIMKGK